MQRFPLLFVRNVTVLLVFCFCLSQVLSARGDATGDKRRAQLAKVQRVIVIPSFFGTDTLGKLDAQKEHPGKVASDAKLTAYGGQLRTIETHVREWLPQRLISRTNFQIVPQEELQAALKDLNLTPHTLFQNAGMLKGKTFALPDIAAVRTLAQRPACRRRAALHPGRTAPGHRHLPVRSAERPELRQRQGARQDRFLVPPVRRHGGAARIYGGAAPRQQARQPNVSNSRTGPKRKTRSSKTFWTN